MKNVDRHIRDFPSDMLYAPKAPKFVRRLLNWEYWSMFFLYLPVFIFDTFCGIILRNPFYFKAVNPGLENGGMYGQSKWDLYQKINPNIQPDTLVIRANTQLSDGEIKNIAERLGFPMIIKPDRGERGNGIHIIHNIEQLKSIPAVPYDNILQEFLDYPLELGIFYIRNPRLNNGVISSLMFRHFTHHTFDGVQSIGEYIHNHPRLSLVEAKLRKVWKDRWNEVPKQGENIQLVRTGNHNKGAIFIDGRKWITPELEETINRIALEIPGFYYGRFDVRAKSWDHLIRGEFILIELNGAHSEPAHIYHPKYPFYRGWCDLIKHHYFMARIAGYHLNRGYDTGRFTPNLLALQFEYKYRKLIS